MVEDRSNPSPKYGARLRFNVGPDASIDTLYRALSDVRQLLSYASQVQKKVDYNEEIFRTLRSSDFDETIFRYAPFRYLDRYGFLPPSIERLIAQRLGELAPHRIVRISRVLYENPFDIKISFNGEGFAKTLAVFRDWKSDHHAAEANARQKTAEARIMEAKAKEYEDLAAQRQLIRGKITEGILDGTLHLSAEQLAEVLADDTIDSFSRLEIAGLDVELDENGNESGNNRA